MRSGLVYKRAHGAVVVIDSDGHPVGVFTEHDAAGFDRFHPAPQRDEQRPGDARRRHRPREGIRAADPSPLVDGAGDRRRRSAARRAHAQGRAALHDLPPGRRCDQAAHVSVAVGINADPVGARQALGAMGVDVLVIDTAHGHQTADARVVEQVRAACPDTPIVAGNVVTADGTRQLIEAGADIVKVGVGPGAMCTTRMMTGVGRPQFSAVVECAGEAARLGKHIWADGGVRWPARRRLALAGVPASVMFGSWLAGTYESAADTLRDPDGRLYKEELRDGVEPGREESHRAETELDRARKELVRRGDLELADVPRSGASGR
jgi:IMP dehydrogenase